MITLQDVQRGYDAWAAKPHNAKWVRKIDGTPIANDLIVNIFEALKDGGQEAEAVAIDDDTIVRLMRDTLPAKVVDELTFERHPPLFPQATYDVPTYGMECFVKAILASRPQPASTALVEAGKPWRVFEDITHGWWGIEVDGDNDADPILYPIKINRERLDNIVERFNEAITNEKIQSADTLLRQNFASFCDADPFPGCDTFADAMEAAGYIELVPVTKEALEEAFAAERGIEPGGMMYRLTDAGRLALSASQSTSREGER